MEWLLVLAILAVFTYLYISNRSNKATLQLLRERREREEEVLTAGHVDRAEKLFDSAHTQSGIVLIALMNRIPEFANAIGTVGASEFFQNRVTVACVAVAFPGLRHLPHEDSNCQTSAVLLKLDRIGFDSKQAMNQMWKFVEEMSEKGHPVEEAIGGWILTETASGRDMLVGILADANSKTMIETFTAIGAGICTVFVPYWQEEYARFRPTAHS